MKVLSLLQPWATLVVMGAKQIETRSWQTQYRGPLLIHASAGFKPACKDLCLQDPFSSYIKHWTDLPLGAIIGKVNLDATGPTDHFITISQDKLQHGWPAQIKWEHELKFGDYSAGRYGWLLSAAEKFATPIPAKGSLSIWEFEMPTL